MLKSCFHIIVASTVLFILSCKKDGYVSISTDMKIQVMNNHGQDLLNNPLIYDENNIRVTYIEDGQSQPNHSSRKFSIDRVNGLNALTVFPLVAKVNKETTITLIQFGTSKPDTIRCEYIIDGGSIYCAKVWFNETIKFNDNPVTNTKLRVFSIMK